MRTDRVWIPDESPRCEPQRYCGDKERCGRYLAPIKRGSSLKDFSTALGVVFIGCPWKLPTSMRPEPKREPVKEWPSED